MRNDFYNNSKRLYGSANKQHQKSVSEFKKLGEKNNIPAERFMRDLDLVGSKGNSNEATVSTQGWDEAKEARYQELLRKRGK
jgi:hypothetical protein